MRSNDGTQFEPHCDDSDTSCNTARTSDDGHLDEHDNARADSPIESLQKPESEGRTADQVRYMKRHGSAITTTSFSSLPQSESESHYAPSQRPRRVLRPSNIRHPHLCSSSSEDLHSPRTPRSKSPRKTVNAKSSPRSHRSGRLDAVAATSYPLILLHITILPTSLPWSQDIIHTTLPESIVDDLALIRSRVSDNIQHRGVLVPHPHQDFDLLKARVLEALELDLYSASNHAHSEDSTDQEDYLRLRKGGTDACEMCGDTACFSLSPRARWDIKVYAANGMLLSGGWEAVWTEMERVDVEILPYIPHSLRRRLDVMQAKEDARREHDRGNSHPVEGGDDSDKEGFYQQVPERASLISSGPEISTAREGLSPLKQCPEEIQSSQPQNHSPDLSSPLTPKLKAKEIPLGVLLSNYIYLLAQDRTSLAFLVLVLSLVLLTILGLRGSATGPAVGIVQESGMWNLPRGPPVVNTSGSVW